MSDQQPPAQPTPGQSPDARDIEIAELKAQLAQQQSSSTSATAGAVDHVEESAIAGAEPGQIVHFRTSPANGDDVAYGYGLVLAVVTVDAEAGGEPVEGQPTRAEVQVARLDVMHNRLGAEQVLDLIG